MKYNLTGSKVGLWSGAHTGRGGGDGAQVEWVQGGSVVWGTHWVGEGDGVQVEGVQGGSVVWGTHWVGGG